MRLLPLIVAGLCLAAVAPAFAGPPFLTDDPEPVPYCHWEFYTFTALDNTPVGNNTAGPAVEVNHGIAKDTQLHLVIPETTVSCGGLASTHGLGDSELGVKYRFFHQTKTAPDIATFPLIELPTGNASKGLGNGRAWLKLPLWLEKDSGAWTTYGGGGYAYNDAPGQRSYGYAGWLTQRTLSPQLALGGELFAQGATVAGSRSALLWNVGGNYNFNPNFSLLFSGGHSFVGESNTVSYLSLYWTWGPPEPGK